MITEGESKSPESGGVKEVVAQDTGLMRADKTKPESATISVNAATQTRSGAPHSQGSRTPESKIPKRT
jgi:hypothetical protein